MTQTITPRMLKVAEGIKRFLASVFQQGDFHNPEIERYNVTVTEVRVSPDLKLAKVYVFPFGQKLSAELIEMLNREKPALRKKMAKALYLKYVPEIAFVPDNSFDQAQNIEGILNKLQDTPQSDEGA